MFEVYYYIDKMPHRYDYVFSTLFGATYKACSIFEEHGFPVDIMDNTTGEILVIIEPNNLYIAPTVNKIELSGRIDKLFSENP